MQRTLRKAIYITLYLFVLGLFIYVSTAIYIANRVGEDSKKNSDVIVVLGAKTYQDGQYDPCLKGRVEHGVALYKEGYAPKIVMTGGPDQEDGTIEAEVMQKIALEAGVPEKDIILEPNSTSTYENMVNTRSILEERHYSSAIIVTAPYHMPRARMTATTNLIPDISVSPATAEACLKKGSYTSADFLREPLALIFYIVTGKI